MDTVCKILENIYEHFKEISVNLKTFEENLEKILGASTRVI